MKILLTGSSGFIGQHLLPKLTSNGHDVHCLVNDLTDYDKISAEVAEVNPQLIIHLAARTEVEKSFYEPVPFATINYLGTINLVNAAAKLPDLVNFLFASTMEVYGWQPVSDEIKNGKIFTELPVFDETTEPHPNAPYAVAKHACEKYLEYAHRSLGLPFCAIRQTNTYGRTDNNFFVVEQIITQMLNDPTEINLGYAEPYRNFLFIDDLIDLWMTLVAKAEQVNHGEIFTIGPDNAVRISELADIIAKKIGWTGIINWNKKPARPGEIYLLNSGYNLINQRIGWQPTTELDVGLDKTINIWQQQAQ
jgi:nucleoside-diphosphate-sugar epimerase